MTEERRFGDPRNRAELVQAHVDSLWRRLEMAGSSLGEASQAYGTQNPLLLAESLIRVYTQEALNTSYAIEPLDELEGFTIAESGHHRFVLHDGLDPQSRIFLHFHTLGHIARGHLRDGELGIKYEYKDRRSLPTRYLTEEQEADEWAVTATDRSTDNPLTAGVRNAILEKVKQLKTIEGEITHYGDVLPPGLIEPEEGNS